MKKRYIQLTLMVLIFSSCNGQNEYDNINKYVSTFSNTESKVLSYHIENIADNVRIIGLGEVSHYTKECYILKTSIIKTLIDKGYNGLILEVDFGQALVWNEYVVNGTWDLDKIIEQSGWFTYRTEEFKGLLKYIKEHNDASEVPFQVFGMEMTANDNNLDWLKIYFKSHSSKFSEVLPLLNEERPVVVFNAHTEKDRREYWDLYYGITKFIKLYEAELLESGGIKKLAIAKRISEIIRQYATYVSHDDFGFKTELRDQFSTRNVNWVLGNLGENSKVIIWAHNGHIAKKSVLFNYDVLGHYLSKWFGDDYYAIGFTFNSGAFGAFSNDGFKKWELQEVEENSLTTYFKSHNSPFLLLNIKDNLASEPCMDGYLYQEHTIRTDVSEFYNGESRLMNINLSKTYDSLIYIDKTSYPTTIEWNRE